MIDLSLQQQLPSLKADQIHLWLIRVNEYLNDLNRLFSWLNQEEKHQAMRFKFNTDRQSYTIAHGMLRFILGYYLNISPENIQIEVGQYGKPNIDSKQNHIDLNFNISHSKNCILIGIAQHQEIGVDIEYQRDKIEFLDIIERFFSVIEVTLFQEVPQAEQCNAFYNRWACKEAVIKAIGLGLFQALDSFDIELSVNQQPRMLNFRNSHLKSDDWRIHLLDLEPHYSAAVAWHGSQKKIFYYC